MPEEVFIVSIVAIVFGTGLVGAVMYGIYSLIKTKIESGNKSSGEINPQFFRALSEFKKNTERRLNNLEAIVSDLEEDRYSISKNNKEKEDTHDIEIEEEEVRSSSGKEKGNESNLRNMLNE